MADGSAGPLRRTGFRIGVNALYILPGAVGGTEIYLRSLLRALADIDTLNQYVIFTNLETGSDLVPQTLNFSQVVQRVHAVSRPRRILWEQFRLPRSLAQLDVDVLLNPGFTAPLMCHVPQATVFHDLQHKRHPEHFRWFDRPFWRFFLYWSARRSRLVIADSEATARDLLECYALPRAKVRVAPLGVDQEFCDLASRRAPEPFLLTVSTLHPHKNLDRLLRAFQLFRRDHPGFRLVVCGLHGFASADLHRLRATLGLDGVVEFPGWIPRPNLLALYRRAWACVLPSTFEGFGLPLLEALAAGVPTACSDVEPLASLARDAALRFNPHDTDAIVGAMRQVTDDHELRARLARAGPEQAARYSWRKTAETTLDALEAVRQ